MKVLITGAGGQLGRELVKVFSEAGYCVFPFKKEHLDITNQQDIKLVFKLITPDIVINAAAYTNVDECETEVEKAFHINGLGPYYLAKEARVWKVSFYHISTDYVFCGNKASPYDEYDHAQPKTVYGKSKRLGEELVLKTYENSSIIRTSWLYGSIGEDFVKTMLKLSEEKSELKVVSDQLGSPTYTKDLAKTILKLINKPYKIYHVTNSGSCTWHDFAKEIFLISDRKTIIKPVTTLEYGSKVSRPNYSVLSHQELNKVGIKMRCWKEAIREYLKEELVN
ncbi:dTDP-4-dehydrorhamnose reductase [Metabacillus fastidiosus]|uniref:dTDP-4-dehydrorhamnose reductase n=1 Tax=Metabacillus fastidiosus TaxID=1458 RepID=UPI003D2C872E